MTRRRGAPSTGGGARTPPRWSPPPRMTPLLCEVELERAAVELLLMELERRLRAVRIGELDKGDTGGLPWLWKLKRRIVCDIYSGIG